MMRNLLQFEKLQSRSISRFFLIIQKTAYLWFMVFFTNDVQDLIDWTLKCILDEEVDGKQG